MPSGRTWLAIGALGGLACTAPVPEAPAGPSPESSAPLSFTLDGDAREGSRQPGSTVALLSALGGAGEILTIRAPLAGDGGLLGISIVLPAGLVGGRFACADGEVVMSLTVTAPPALFTSAQGACTVVLARADPPGPAGARVAGSFTAVLGAPVGAGATHALADGRFDVPVARSTGPP